MAFSKIILNGQTLIDLTGDTVATDNLLTSYTAHDAAGLAITGEASGGGGQQDWRKDDGKTYLHIDIDSDYLLTVNLRFQQSVSNGHSIDWGDESSEETISGTSKQTLTHTYAKQDGYIIKITNSSGEFWLGENDITKAYIFQDGVNNSSTDKYKHYCRILKKLELGTGWACDNARQFQACHELTDVYISAAPNGTTFQGNMFNECKSLKTFTWKENVMNNVTSLPTAPFRGCFSLTEPVFFPNVTSIPQNYSDGSAYVRSSIKTLKLPSGITSVGATAFRYHQSAVEIDIPSTVASIGANAFANALSVHAIHVRATSPPALSNSNAFTVDTTVYNPVIYVPYSADHSVLASYQTETNWSSLSSYMQEEQS